MNDPSQPPPQGECGRRAKAARSETVKAVRTHRASTSDASTSALGAAKEEAVDRRGFEPPVGCGTPLAPTRQRVGRACPAFDERCNNPVLPPVQMQYARHPSCRAAEFGTRTHWQMSNQTAKNGMPPRPERQDPSVSAFGGVGGCWSLVQGRQTGSREHLVLGICRRICEVPVVVDPLT